MTADIDPLISFAAKQLDKWEPGAMLPSEVAWLLQSLQTGDCTLLIECGRQDGVSTELFGRFLMGRNVTILSIDFDSNPERARRAQERVAGLDVQCLTGDIHDVVPRLIEEHSDHRIAVLQDGPKGWEGLSTLLAAATYPQVRVIAQHNLHIGHVTRELFRLLSRHPCFIEDSSFYQYYERLLEREREAIGSKQPNREIDHTSLGVMAVDPFQRKVLLSAFELLIPQFSLWNPARVRHQWDSGNFRYCSQLRKRARFLPARFKKR